LKTIYICKNKTAYVYFGELFSLLHSTVFEDIMN
jgi:hypothetical protein